MAPPGYPAIHDPSFHDEIERAFAPLSRRLELSRAQFETFKRGCGYAEAYRAYMGSRLLDEKLLEHYVSLELLDLAADDILIDVGSAVSPFSDFVRDRIGCQSYSLDLAYPPGVHGHKIGCSVDAIPLEAGSVSALVLHCALDHFEGACDTLFIGEAARILRPGGRLCILPVYFAPAPVNICDPAHFAPDIAFDPEAGVMAAAGHTNRFGRFYSAETFRRRILEAAPELRPELYRIAGERASIPDNYLYFALLLRKSRA